MPEKNEVALAKGCITYPFWVIGTGLVAGFFVWPLILGINLSAHKGFTWITDGPAWRWPILFAWWLIIAGAVAWWKKASTNKHDGD